MIATCENLNKKINFKISVVQFHIKSTTSVKGKPRIFFINVYYQYIYLHTISAALANFALFSIFIQRSSHPALAVKG